MGDGTIVLCALCGLRMAATVAHNPAAHPAWPSFCSSQIMADPEPMKHDIPCVFTMQYGVFKNESDSKDGISKYLSRPFVIL